MMNEGKVPLDLELNFEQKSEVDYLEYNRKFKKVNSDMDYYYFQMDFLLHHEQMVFGNETCKYLEDIISKIKSANPEIKSNFQVFLLKTSYPVLFSSSTRKIICCSTGLLAHLEKESQVAFSLSIMMAHCELGHLINDFQSRGERLNYELDDELSAAMNNYKHEDFISADKLAIGFINDADYEIDQIGDFYNIAAYTYLGFEEFDFSKKYFNADLLQFPSTYFLDKPLKIKSVEEMDSKKMLFPELVERRELAKKYVKEIGYSPNKKPVLPNLVMKPCRLETIRSYIFEGLYYHALYGIAVLENENQASSYLQKMKAHVWFSILGNLRSVNNSKANKVTEGKLGEFHFFLSKLSKEQLVTLGIRQLADLNKNKPGDAEIQNLFFSAVFNLKYWSGFKMNKFYDYSLEEAKRNFAEGDTLKPSDSDSKVQKIKYTRAKPDTVNFHLYGLADLIKSKRLQSMMDSIDVAETKNNASKFIYLNNEVYAMNKWGLDDSRTRINRDKMYSAIRRANGPNARKKMALRTVDELNEEKIINSYLIQIDKHESRDSNSYRVIPIDYQLIEDLRNKNPMTCYKTISLNSHYEIGTNFANGKAGILEIFFFPNVFVSTNEHYFTVSHLNLQKYRIEATTNVQISSPVTKALIGKVLTFSNSTVIQ